MDKSRDVEEIRREVSKAIFWLVVVISIFGMLEGALKQDFLNGIVPGITKAGFNAYLSIFLAAGALLASYNTSRLSRGLSLLLSSILVVIAGLSFLEWVLNINFGIDELFVKDPDNIPGRVPGRIFPGTAFCLTLTGAAILIRNRASIALQLIHQWFFHIVTLFALTMLLYNFFSLPFNKGIATVFFISVIPSFTLFLLSFIAVLAYPDRGIISAFSGNKIGNIAARKTFLRLLVATILLAIMRVLSHKWGNIDVRLGISLQALSFIIISLIIIVRSSSFLNKMEARTINLENTLEKNLKYLDATPDALIIVDKQGVIRLSNKKCIDIFGYEKEELDGQHLHILMPDSKSQGHQHNIDTYFTNPSKRQLRPDLNLVARKKNGEIFPVDISLNPIKFSDGEFVSASIRDISEKKAMAQNLIEISERLSLATNNTGIAIWELNITENLISLTPTLQQLHGLTNIQHQRIDYTTWLKMLYADDAPVVASAITQAIQDKNGIDVCFRVVWPNRSEHYLKIKANIHKDSTGNINRLLGTCWDVTKEKIAEQAMKISMEQNFIFIKQAPSAIAMFDTDMRYLAASHKWITDYHLEGVPIIGRTHYEVFPEIGENWKAIHQRCLKGEIDVCPEASFERQDGSLQWISWDVRPWYTPENMIGGIIMNTNDITPLKESIQERLKIEEILERSNEIARIGSWEYHVAKNKLEWSHVTRLIHEVGEEYIPEVATAIDFYKSGENREKIAQVIQEAMETGKGWDVKTELVTQKGTSLWIRSIGFAEIKKGKCVRLYGVFQDITETKKYEEQIQSKNVELNAILNSGYVSVISTDKDGIITHFNKGAELLLQYTAEEMIGKHTPIMIHKVTEIEERAKDLSELLGRNVEGFETFVALPKERGTHYSNEWTYIRKDGSQFPVQLITTAIRNENNEINGYVGVATDITAIRKAQDAIKTLLNTSTEQNERLNNFAHIVSHNLRSHATNFSMLLSLVDEVNPELAEHEMVQLLKTASANLKETVDHLTDIVKINTSVADNMKSINLSNAFQSSVNNISEVARNANVSIINEIPNDCFISGIPAYVDSILLNFITNGIKYRSQDREAYIKVSTFIKDEFVAIRVEDNGRGIDLKKHGNKLFGMYKTFHGNKDARGVGLFITKNQIEAMGGRVEVESEVNKGTCFTIYLKEHEKSKLSMHH